jgi:FkbM family methyltransferase
MMISYGGNHEDVVLARVFDAQPRGFYIDVGANHPTWGSLTKHFYDRSWTGINVEPQPDLYALLKAERPNDLNLQCGIGKSESKLTLYAAMEPLYRGLATFDRAQAELHAKELRIAFEEVTVPVTTLAKLCKQHVRQPIDFLSIDVEGHEREVLLGADFKRYRPRVLIIEATQPMQQVPTHDKWEELLLKADYLYALFDGANRFYVRAEDRELLPRLSMPVSSFDKYVPHLHDAEKQQLRHEHRLQENHLQLELAASQKTAEYYRQELIELRARMANVGPLSLGLANRIVEMKERYPGVVSRLEKLTRAVGRK